MTWLTRKLYRAVDKAGNELWSDKLDRVEAERTLAQYAPGARLQELVRSVAWVDVERFR